IAQKEYNNEKLHPGGIKVRLLIAKSGSSSANVDKIARQIASAKAKDHSIVAVLGWANSGASIDALRTLSTAHIPMIAPTASYDTIGQNGYFSRVTPTNKEQAQILTRYIKDVLQPKQTVVLEAREAYSQNLANDFVQDFQNNGYSIEQQIFFDKGK